MFVQIGYIYTMCDIVANKIIDENFYNTVCD